jgi:hypothetical protein
MNVDSVSRGQIIFGIIIVIVILGLIGFSLAEDGFFSSDNLGFSSIGFVVSDFSSYENIEVLEPEIVIEEETELENAS